MEQYAASFGVFLAGLVVGSVAISVLVACAIMSWGHSLTRLGMSGAVRSPIGEASLSASAERSPESTSAGSSSSKQTADPTSTSSQTSASTDTGSQGHGPRSSDARATAAHVMNLPELASSASARAAAEQRPTPGSTPQSSTKRPCRLCSKIRALVGFGGSSETAAPWQLPPLSETTKSEAKSSVLPSTRYGITFAEASNDPKFGTAGSTGATSTPSRQRKSASRRSRRSKR